MASTATSRLRLEKQGSGENLNSWGAKLNASGLDLIDSAIAGVESYALSGSKTLSSTNYVADEARMRVQNITGGTGGTVTIPGVQSWYLVRNNSSGSVIFTTGGGTTATIIASTVAPIICDGTNVYAMSVSAYEAALQAAVTAAQLAETNAETAETNAETAETNAAASASAAATSAATAATVVQATSTSSVLIGTGAKSFTTQAGKNFPTGTRLRFASNANPTVNFMVGAVTSYAGTTLNVTIDEIGDSAAGTLADWSISLTGTRGTTGATGATGPAANWTQISSSALSGASVSFTSIPQTYGALLLDVSALSGSSSANLVLGISPDGSTWYSHTLEAALAAANSRSIAFEFDRYTGDRGPMFGGYIASGFNGILADIGATDADVWVCPGGIQAIRLTLSAGTFDAGTATLYRR